MALFTIVLDLAGGTYIEQVTARSVIQALREWARIAPSLKIPLIGAKFPDHALKNWAFLDPTPIDTFRNVWCTSFTIRGSVGVINVIATDQHAREKGVSDLERLVAAPSTEAFRRRLRKLN